MDLGLADSDLEFTVLNLSFSTNRIDLGPDAGTFSFHDTTAPIVDFR